MDNGIIITTSGTNEESRISHSAINRRQLDDVGVLILENHLSNSLVTCKPRVFRKTRVLLILAS